MVYFGIGKKGDYGEFGDGEDCGRIEACLNQNLQDYRIFRIGKGHRHNLMLVFVPFINSENS